MKRLILGAFATFLGVAPITAVAQSVDDDIAALSAAVSAVQQKLPPGPTALVYNDHTAALARRFSRQTGKRIDHVATKIKCQQDAVTRRAQCSWDHLNSAVSIGAVHVVGDAATAYVYVNTPSNSKLNPVESDGYVIELSRVNGKWVPASITLSVIS